MEGIVRMKIDGKHLPAWIGLLAMVSACAGPTAQPGGSGQQSSPAPIKTTAILGISAPIPAFSFAYLGTSGGGAQSFNELWQQMLSMVQSDGEALPDDELVESDVILPPRDITFEDACAEFTGEGLIPD